MPVDSTLLGSVGKSLSIDSAAPSPGQDRFLALANSSPPAASQHCRRRRKRRRRGAGEGGAGGRKGRAEEDIALRQDMAYVGYIHTCQKYNSFTFLCSFLS